MASLSESEIEFLAEETMIQIQPLFHMESIPFMTRSYGPFRAQIGIDVPLWLAIQLKKYRKCRVVAPEWMQIESLTLKLDAEKKEYDVFTPMPFHYIAVASALMDVYVLPF